MRGDPLRGWCRPCDRQSDPDNRAGAVALIVSRNAAAMRLDEAAADRQAKTGAGATAVLRLHAVELIEYPFAVGRRYSRSFVGYLDHDCLALAAGVQCDEAPGWRVFRGIVEQIEQNLLEQYGIDPHQRQVGRDINFNAVMREHVARPMEHRAGNLGQIEPFEFQLDRPRFKPRHVEQVGDEASKTLRLFL